MAHATRVKVARFMCTPHAGPQEVANDTRNSTTRTSNREVMFASVDTESPRRARVSANQHMSNLGRVAGVSVFHRVLPTISSVAGGRHRVTRPDPQGLANIA